MGLKYFFIFAFSFIEFSSGQTFGEICENSYCIDGTTCLNNLCQCRDGLEHFLTNGQCGKRVETMCEGRGWECVMGSACDTTTDTCQCTSPSIPAENGACSLGFGSYCPKNQTCTPDSSLTCLNNRCVCGFGTISEYDPMDPYMQMVPGDCRVKNDGKCNANNEPKCVENAQCIGGECRCNSGYGDDTTGQCKKLHSKSCIPKNVHRKSNDCNQARGLFCIDDICQCQEPNKWDIDTQSCLTGLGEICSGTAGCLDPNADCVGKYEFEPRLCKCSQGFIEAQSICMKDPNLSNCVCTRDENIFDCTGKLCGNYPLKNDQTRFIQCIEGTGIVHSCPPYLEFNADISLCELPHTS